MIDKKASQEIKFLQQMSFSADVIAKSMKIPVEQVCDVLGYPRDKKGRETAHKDYNFYFHGQDKHGVERLETYGMFLREGDFEKWQPVCYMDKNSDEFKKLKEEAEKIPESDDTESETRRLWILSRFPEYLSEEWGIIDKKMVDKFKELEGSAEIIERGSKGIEDCFFI